VFHDGDCKGVATIGATEEAASVKIFRNPGRASLSVGTLSINVTVLEP